MEAPMIHIEPDWWQHLFDELYLITDARSVCDDHITSCEVNAFEEFLGLDPGQDILDLCGGHGRHSLELCRRGYTNLTVFDFSRPLLERGKETAAKEGLEVNFCQGDARCTGFDDERFEVVVLLGNSFGYFMDDKDDLAMLKEANRVLKTGGILGMDITDGDFIEKHFKEKSEHKVGYDIIVQRFRERHKNQVRVKEIVFSIDRGEIRKQTYASRLYNAQALIAILEKAGFKNIIARTGFTCHTKPGDFGFMTNRILAKAEK
jgi:D-alanine-D-alanine ligase